jgi:hypothetical protein
MGIASNTQSGAADTTRLLNEVSFVEIEAG